MAAKLTRLTYKLAIQLHLVAESCAVCSSYFRRSVRKLLDTPSCIVWNVSRRLGSMPFIAWYIYITIWSTRSSPRVLSEVRCTERSKLFLITHIYWILLLLSLAPQPSLGLGLLHKIRLNFLEVSEQFPFLQGRVVSLTPYPHSRGPGLCIYIPQRQGGPVIPLGTHFSRLLRHAWNTVGLFLFPGHHMDTIEFLMFLPTWMIILDSSSTCVFNEVYKNENYNKPLKSLQMTQ
jgi:hypothetical protein